MGSPLDSLVTVTITAALAQPKLPNFGTPAILAYHVHNSDYIRTYSDLAGMVSDNFSTTEPAYLMATAILSQSPTTPTFKVIRSTGSVTQTCTFEVTDNTDGDVVGFKVTGVNRTVTSVYVTVSSQTKAQVATALAALSAPNGTTMAAGGAGGVFVTVAAAASKNIFYVEAVKGGNWLDNTVDNTTNSTDLTNASIADPAWYGVASERQDVANITTTSAACDTLKRIHAYTTPDTNNLGSGTGVGAALKALGYHYSFGQYSSKPIGYGALALMANRFTAGPGTDTWAYKSLSGVLVDSLTSTNITNLNGNYLNYYESVAGVSITQVGILADGVYADLRRGIDALAAQIQIQVYALLVTLPKVPYDPAGLAMVAAEVMSAIQQFTASNSKPAALLRNDTGFQPLVTVPAISATLAIDRAARVLKNVNFTCYAQNAVQTVQVNGTVSL